MQVNNDFLSLINQHQNIIHKVCNIYMHDAADKEDLFQEITLQAWNAYKNFRGDAKFSTWLYRVALNTAISFYRKEKRKPVFEFSANEFPERAEESNEIEEQMQAMYAAIATLSKIDKALVMLYLEDYSYDEIGNMLGITANNVAVKMNRIKTKLKEESKKHYQFS
ncbi:sigma-70 family RNA polymerase sigma factor [Panacibacter sp. DH6]|uniref:Sigma-70 family RNA polymerase sigma factor n=1 Tax=Panacibacter microcysteis TaxID=2793269 RepID=A0A931E4N0_9BACT|nr:sigma-70 family RNA polymerase sigma factor [Panacibacter microcysteis]MBG9377595.1 sigma-70 family RNA polymerase sigma factor [Panacibacter microcysteis]